MPLVRVDIAEGTPPEFRKSIGEIVYNAMTDVINVPKDDKLQVITEHPIEELNFAENYLGIRHTRDIILIQITLNHGRTVELKKAFYKRVTEDLHRQLRVRPEDVIINLVEVPKENWSFGNGVAQYAS